MLKTESLGIGMRDGEKLKAERAGKAYPFPLSLPDLSF
jgi:hypothetical protein